MKPIARTIGRGFLGLLIAAFGIVKLNAVAAQAPPPPAPPPPEVVTHVSQQIFNQLNAAAPSAPRSTFRLIAPQSVEAGQDIKVEIVLDSGAGGDYSFKLFFEPSSLVRSPPIEAVLANGTANWSGSVSTDPDVKGSPTLHIYFAPEKGAPGISGSREVDVTIRPKPTYDVSAPSGEVVRGNDFQFTVARQGGSGASQVRYEVSQDGNIIQSGALDFNDNALSQPVRVSGYDVCGAAPSLQILDVAGNTTATPNLSPELPRGCGFTPLPPTPWWWPWVLIPVAVVGGWIIWRTLRALRKWWRDRHKQPPAPDLRTSFEMRGGETRFPNGEPPLESPPAGDAP